MADSNRDDDATPDADELTERETVQLRFNVARSFLEDLIAAYPNAGSASQAGRMAVLDGVEFRQGRGASMRRSTTT